MRHIDVHIQQFLINSKLSKSRAFEKSALSIVSYGVYLTCMTSIAFTIIELLPCPWTAAFDHLLSAVDNFICVIPRASSFHCSEIYHPYNGTALTRRVTSRAHRCDSQCEIYIHVVTCAVTSAFNNVQNFIFFNIEFFVIFFLFSP